jgi:hypothetical protein
MSVSTEPHQQRLPSLIAVSGVRDDPRINKDYTMKRRSHRPATVAASKRLVALLAPTVAGGRTGLGLSAQGC